MENIYLYIGFIGSIASIISAIWSYKSAIKAKKSQTEIEEFRKNILKRKETSEIDKISLDMNKVLQELRFFSSSSTEKTSKGKATQPIAKLVEEFQNLLKQNINTFHNQEFHDLVNNLCKNLPEIIKYFVEATDFEDKKKYGSQIHLEISELLPIINKISQKTFE